jgi:hypothetical protein
MNNNELNTARRRILDRAIADGIVIQTQFRPEPVFKYSPSSAVPSEVRPTNAPLKQCTQAWLALLDWESVTAVNAALCAVKSALHKPTSDGHDETKAYWEALYQNEMDLLTAIEVCRKCHRLAPFCNYNGNTFAAIIHACIDEHPIAPPQDQAFIRSCAGRIVAGTDALDELRRFTALLANK